MKRAITLIYVVAFGLILSAALVAQQPAFDFSTLEDDQQAAVFAGGCFWCMEPPYDKLDGVDRTIVGYAGGDVENPTYRQVTRGNTGHYEVVLIVYRPNEISYAELLDTFWVNIDPTDDGGQFCDRGSSYLSAVFYLNEMQEAAARESKRELARSNRLPGPVVTEIKPLDTFWVGEEYHQNYYRKNPLRYRSYRTACGRDARLRQLWGADAPS
jgi:methionine-S-sulfoxide reductase